MRAAVTTVRIRRCWLDQGWLFEWVFCIALQYSWYQTYTILALGGGRDEPLGTGSGLIGSEIVGSWSEIVCLRVIGSRPCSQRLDTCVVLAASTVGAGLSSRYRQHAKCGPGDLL